MNILASYNWIKEYVTTRETAEAFARKVSLCGPGVERLHPQGEAYANMVVGRILGVRPHPNADKLRLAAVDLGDRQAEFVCGGVNLAPGMKVAVALEGAMVRWHGEGEPVRLEPATIRGIKSEGMICAADEIGLGEAFPHAHMEIMDLSWCKARPGTALAKALELDDTVFDIEVTSNRVDAFSIVGLAREAAAVLGAKFAWKVPVLPSPAAKASHPPLTVKNRAERLCPRYQAVVMEGVTVGPSPWWLKKRLIMSGIRPINNVVDITNYVMLEFGQPMHVFDYEKLDGRAINVRPAEAGETILALDGRSYAFQPGQLVIADARRPIAVAGVMGGEETGVTEGTRLVVFEAANFDPVSVRRTARALNLYSDSSLRFEKGLPEELVAAAMARAVELTEKIACGRVAARPVDLWPSPPKKTKYPFRPEKAEKLIGVRIPRPQMVGILKSLGFQVTRVGEGKAPRYEVTVPYWRVRDIEDERDFAEEIARIYGYHNLPAVLPSGEIPVELPNPVLVLENQLRDLLKGAGYTEAFTYSLVSAASLERCGLVPVAALRVANPLTVDFECLRPSLAPGLLDVVKGNQGLFPSGRLFEVSNVYERRLGAQLPAERPMFMAMVYGSGFREEEIEKRYREARGILESVAEAIGLAGIELTRSAVGDLWHPGQSAAVMVDGERIGTVGELHPAVRERFGIDGGVAVVELDLEAALSVIKPVQRYRPISQFPPVRRDLAVKVVGETAEHERLKDAAKRASRLLTDFELFDIYRGAGLGGIYLKSLAFHLTFTAPDRTLTAEEADAEVEKILVALEGQGANRR
jgi:phenylalanyl-tRNA synthetase beta chain